MMIKAIDELNKKKIVTTTNHKIDLKHLLSAERAARGSFYATRVGFVAVNPKGFRIARAHNGFPIGVTETRERWSKAQKDFYHLHAECAGVFHALRHGYACEGATAYVTHPPCPGCLMALITSGFKRVVFSEQALLERQDWREDMIKTFDIAQQSRIEMSIYRDKERSLKYADITRTEVALKKTYDDLLPQARWSSTDVSEISKATKPESSEWVEQPVVHALLLAAKEGVMLGGKTVAMDFLPECRAATALIQAGVKEIIIKNNIPDNIDARWAVALELKRAEEILKRDAKIVINSGEAPKDKSMIFNARRN